MTCNYDFIIIYHFHSRAGGCVCVCVCAGGVLRSLLLMRL